MRLNHYEAARLHLARRIARAFDVIPPRVIGGCVMIFALLAVLAYHANKPAPRAPATEVCIPVAKARNVNL